MYSWQQGVFFSVGQENRECCIFTSDVRIRGIHLSLTLGSSKFKQID